MICDIRVSVQYGRISTMTRYNKARFPYECLLLSIEDMVRGSLKMYSNVMEDERSFRGTCGRRSGVVKKVVNG